MATNPLIGTLAFRRLRPLGGVVLSAALLAGCAAGFQAANPVQVEILVRGTDDFRAHYDYVTWAPAPTLVRIVPRPGADPNATVTIVLTNAAPAEAGRGHVNFATDAAAYKQAIEAGRHDLDRITVTLKADGTPQHIVVAGDFPHYSGRDKDTEIVAHADTPSGPVLGHAALMVRVRRNEDTLTAEERDRFLWALATLRFRKPAAEQQSTYDFLVHIHDIAGFGQPDGPTPGPKNYPDQAHKSAGFLPWHRSFLLEMERSLQQIDPSVTLPYWPIYLAPQGRPGLVFDPGFTGANSTATDPALYVPELPRFSFGNPLYGWNMGSLGPLMRWTNDRTQTAAFNTPDALINDGGSPFRTQYAFLAGSVESNPHNIGHGWAGVWMSNCLISPGDPMFWPFHTYFDWLWAAWQQHYDRFDRSGRDAADYSPNDHYKEGDPISGQIPLGHHLDDTMWPWNQEAQPVPVPVFNSRRPAERVGGKFPPADAAGLWPAAPATPTPADMIDYAGYESAADDLGVGYDSIPWSPKQAKPPVESQAKVSADALAGFLDTRRAPADRLAQLPAIDLAAAAAPARVAAIEAVAKAAGSPPALKAAALDLLGRIDTTAAVETAFRMERDHAGLALRLEIDRIRALRMFATHAVPRRPVATAAAATAAGLDPKLYGTGQNGAPDSDPAMVATMTAALEKFLAKPADPVKILPQDAVAFIAATQLFAGKTSAGPQMAGMTMAGSAAPAATLAVMRKILLAERKPAAEGVDWWQTKALAAIVLARDTELGTAGLIRSLAEDAQAPVLARAIALNALRHQPLDAFAPAAFAIAGNAAEPGEMRAHAIAAIGALLMDRGPSWAPGDLAQLKARLATLPGTGLPPMAVAALQTTERLLALAAG